MFGFLIFLLGLTIIINELIPINLWHYLGFAIQKYWPGLAAAYFLNRLIRKKGSKKTNLYLITIFSFILLNNIFDFQFDTFKLLLGFLLIIIGLQSISPRQNSAKQKSKDIFLDLDLLNETYFFANKRILVQSKDFSGGDLCFIYSNIILDLREVDSLNYFTQLSLNLNLSEITLLVPDSWQVQDNNGTILKESELATKAILSLDLKARFSNIKFN